MRSSSPAFPPFDQWQAMSEAEQDALIARLETARRWQKRLRRVLLGVTGIGLAAAAAVGLALYAQLLN
jgi:hypothetical protein